MTQVIIYKQDNGIPAVMMPTQEALAKYGIHAIAKKDVPAGKPYAIVEASSLPQNVPQEAWVIEDADLKDGVGAISNEFPE
jgi:hypothetical protein